MDRKKTTLEELRDAARKGFTSAATPSQLDEFLQRRINEARQSATESGLIDGMEALRLESGGRFQYKVEEVANAYRDPPRGNFTGIKIKTNIRADKEFDYLTYDLDVEAPLGKTGMGITILGKTTRLSSLPEEQKQGVADQIERMAERAGKNGYTPAAFPEQKQGILSKRGLTP